ncbi:MAG: glutathione peroxidase [Bacteroidota bacterium]
MNRNFVSKALSLISLPFVVIAAACARPAERPTNATSPMNAPSFYELPVNDLSGKAFDLHSLKGKKVLIVNTASECGYTPQYEQLQQLHEQYGDKIAVIGVPCNQFGGQEPGDASTIASFCSKNYHVTFTMLSKSDVKGGNKSVLFNWLTDKSLNGWNEQEPSWNFCKYVLDEQGKLIAFYPSSVKPLDDKIISGLK